MPEEVLTSREEIAQQFEAACLSKANDLARRIWASLNWNFSVHLPEELSGKIVDVFGVKKWVDWLFDGVMAEETRAEYCLYTKLGLNTENAIEEIRKRLLALEGVRIDTPHE